MTTGQRRNRGSAWAIWLLAAPAFVAIWSGWVGLGQLCGFGKVQPLPGIWDSLTLDTSITLPIGMEAYAAYAIRVWLAGDCSPAATAFARRSTIAALAVGSAGQVVYHLLTAAGVTSAPWPVTAAAAVLPVAVLGMGATLAHLVAQPYTPPTDAEQVVTEVDHAHPATTTSPSRRASTHDASPTATRSSEPRRAAGTRGKGKPSAPGGTTATTPAGKTGSTSRGTAGGTAELVAELLDADPFLTDAAIADRLGKSERTARRYRTAYQAANTSPATTNPSRTNPVVATPASTADADDENQDTATGEAA